MMLFWLLCVCGSFHGCCRCCCWGCCLKFAALVGVCLVASAIAAQLSLLLFLCWWFAVVGGDCGVGGAWL